MRGLAAVALALLSGAGAARAETLAMPNGAEIDLLPGTTAQTPCFFMGQPHPVTDAVVCVEIPRARAEANPDAWNQYAARLINAGFAFAGGAANQYWFDWPVSADCSQRLNMTALPKRQVDGDDWSGLGAYVAVFEAMPTDCAPLG
ncbi:MAG: hypothetical protein AAF486_02290 [Pseudomonadota bacterium]